MSSGSSVLGRRFGTGRLVAAIALAAVFALAAGACAPNREKEPPATPEVGRCEAVCGIFKEETCEVIDAAAEPSCQCVRGANGGAYTNCRCGDGSKPSGCRCSEAPNDSCDPDDPPDDCGSCQCGC